MTKLNNEPKTLFYDEDYKKFLTELKDQIISGKQISYQEAIKLLHCPLDTLTKVALKIQHHFCQNKFDMCSITNGKCGACSEDCKYCAQSDSYQGVSLEAYGLKASDEIIEEGMRNYLQGVPRFSLVASGRKLSSKEIETLSKTFKQLKKKTSLKLCISGGLLNSSDLRTLKSSGIERIHCNLETSENFFPQICTTHTFQDKIKTIKAAQMEGLSVCSGGILGLGETMEDRIRLAFSLNSLGIKSIPVNVLNPIKGTPLENQGVLGQDEVCRTIAIFRLINPDAFIRLAGGRGLFPDQGERALQSGANGVITGDMLTTGGITVQGDYELTRKLNYKVGAYE